MELGDKVYTVNNKTGEVDSWEYSGAFRTGKEILCHLINGKKYCFLPARCVFATEEKARKVAAQK